jgi:hypothetical protein
MAKRKTQKHKAEREEEYPIECFAGLVTTFPSILAPDVTKPSILVRYEIFFLIYSIYFYLNLFLVNDDKRLIEFIL